jgi:hypothetical protein
MCFHSGQFNNGSNGEHHRSVDGCFVSYKVHILAPRIAELFWVLVFLILWSTDRARSAMAGQIRSEPGKDPVRSSNQFWLPWPKLIMLCF